MTPQQITQIRDSFALVQPMAEEVAALFYHHLFAADASLRPMFKGDMQQQGALLMTMLGAAVRILDRPDSLLPVLRSLGARHAHYGVQDAHYATVGAALIQTLTDGLGELFTDELRAAWLALYGVVSTTMMAAGKDAALPMAA
ncbi:MAG: hemin receptor [Burkholderiaceae bacterium]|nr:hemin receptor [Burkholderiaceae bacterium]